MQGISLSLTICAQLCVLPTWSRAFLMHEEATGVGGPSPLSASLLLPQPAAVAPQSGPAAPTRAVLGSAGRPVKALPAQGSISVVGSSQGDSHLVVPS